MEIGQTYLEKEIPGIFGYYATNDGNILDSNKQKLKVYLRDQYNWVHIKGTEYKVATLVLKAFVQVPAYISNNPMANHFNLNKLDDRLENLDWVDRKWNGIHSFLMTAKSMSTSSYILIKWDTGLMQTCRLDDAAKFLNVTEREVWESIKSGAPINGYTLEYVSRVSKTESGRIANKSVARDPNKFGESFSPLSRPIKIMDVTNMEIIDYPNIFSAAKAHGVKLTHIRNRIATKESPKMFHKRYIIVDAEKGFNWVTPPIIKMLLERGDKKVVVYITKKKTFKVYNSARSFIMNDSGQPNKRATIMDHLKKKGYYQAEEFFISYLPVEREHEHDLYLIEVMAGVNGKK